MDDNNCFNLSNHFNGSLHADAGASILGGLARIAPIEKLGGRFFGTLGGN